MTVSVRERHVDDAERRARLEAWFRAHGDRVLAYLLHRTDRDTAQDVLQEVFVTALRKAETVPEPPIGWLINTARHVLANTTRSARRRDRLALRLVDDVTLYVDPAGSDDAPLLEAMAELPAADREVLTLSAWYELTAAEAAEALGCSHAAYRVRLHRARRRLVDQLTAAGHPLAVSGEASR